jgi:hypothetical protein
VHAFASNDKDVSDVVAKAAFALRQAVVNEVIGSKGSTPKAKEGEQMAIAIKAMALRVILAS